MIDDVPQLTHVYLFVEDMAASLGFYERLGLTIEHLGDTFARAQMPGGIGLEFGTAELTRRYDPNWQEPHGPGTNTLNLQLASSEAVDQKFAELTAAGYEDHLSPIDAFWGSRFAIVDDPDGNVIGLHGPRNAPRGGQ